MKACVVNVSTHSTRCPVNTLYAAALLAEETLIIDDFFERQDGPLDFSRLSRVTR
jgi:hypothetical protein